MAKEKINPEIPENQPIADPQTNTPTGRSTLDDFEKLLTQQAQLLEALVKQNTANIGNVQVNFGSNRAALDEEKDLKEKLDEKLHKFTPVTVAFPPCSDVMLSLIKCKNYQVVNTGRISFIEYENDLITKMFLEYFGFQTVGTSDVAGQSPHNIISSHNLLDEGWNNNIIKNAKIGILDYNWPPTWCLPASYVTLNGQRHFYSQGGRTTKRLFLADAVWLFYMERMGLFQILGRILDEYAYNGSFPISNGSVDTQSTKDDVLALVLEAMTRQMEMGTASKVRDRTALYCTALGWILDNGRKLGMETTVNTAFNIQFHKFIYLSLQYYKDKRIKDAIQASTTNTSNSGATMVSIRSTMNLLKKSFDNFQYGRNYYNTLSGIVWAVSAFAVIRDIRETIGIPTQYDEPYDYIPEMYDRLVSKAQAKKSDVNRFETHYECATNARDILIDIELLDTSATNAKDQEIETWLSIIETKVEGYRSAYRALTGVDLGATMVSTQEPVIEQQV